MEKVLSPDERIKRAEEIYYRRKNNELSVNYERINFSNNKKDFTLFKKIVLQILICIVVYSIFYMIKNTEYIFSESVINKTKEILSYDINIQNLYNNFTNYLNSFSVGNKNDEGQEKNMEERATIFTENNVTDSIIEESLVENTIEVQPEINQMDQDEGNILETEALIIPLKGTITSRFGYRQSDNPIVTNNHTGIDIGADEGTVFYSAMSGTVKEVSSKRKSWKSFKCYKQ